MFCLRSGPASFHLTIKGSLHDTDWLLSDMLQELRMEKLVSILIPAFNAQAWIANTIQSALAQTYPRKEIIIVDDGSSDATYDIALQYESSSLRVVHQENEGACRARNRALRECQGDYIQWLDADDLLAPNKIQCQLTSASCEDDPDVLLSSGWGKFYCRVRKAHFSPTPLWQDLDPVSWLVLRLTDGSIMINSAWLVSRQLTEKAGPWDDRLLRDQDGEYFCRLVSLCRLVKFVSGTSCYYRIANLSSISNSVSYKAWESQFLAYELIIRHVLDREDSERTRKACVALLNMSFPMLRTYAPDLLDSLRARVSELGGAVTPPTIPLGFALAAAFFGERRARFLKEAMWRMHRYALVKCDCLLARLFGK
jgi:glycosyltransferase involved in cell wall biosynthesis